MVAPRLLLQDLHRIGAHLPVEEGHTESYMGSSSQLPDLYSKKLEIPASGPVQSRIKKLARRHQEITELALNWHGTYHHAAQRLIRRVQVENSCAWDFDIDPHDLVNYLNVVKQLRGSK